MGLRGPGAARLRIAKEALPKRARKLPWEKPGLPRAQRVIALLEFLPITKGILAGEQMRLLPEQRAFVMDVYGRPEAKRPRLAVFSEPRGNGKTGFIAGLELCHLLGPEAEQRGECYSAAIDRQQAGIIFNEMEAIILAVPEFAARVNIQRFHKRIEVLDGDGKGSTYEALSADARRAHGLAPTFWAYDEMAQSKDRVLLDNLQTAMGKRKRSLGIIISTQAPSDEHPLSQIIDDGLTKTDPSVVVHLLAAPEGADPFDPDVIRSVNPAFGKFLSEKDVLSEAERARRIPAFEPAFRNLRLNQRVDSSVENRVITREVWEACRGEHVPIDLDRMKGRECFAGLDLSGKHDLSSLVLAFPDDAKEPNYSLACFAWTPEGAMQARRPAEQNLFKVWANQGVLTFVPGPVVRYGFIARQLIEIRKTFKLKAVAYDRWRIDDLKQELAALGVQEGDLPLEPYGQGFKDMSPAIEWFAELALTGRLRHGGNPVLTAAVANAITVADEAGNQKIDKDKSNRSASVRIDPAVAAIMALGIAKRFVGEAPVNIDLDGWLKNPVAL